MSFFEATFHPGGVGVFVQQVGICSAQGHKLAKKLSK